VPSVNWIDDLDFFVTPVFIVVRETVSKEIVLSADKGNGLQIGAAFVRRDAQIILELGLQNQSSAAVNGLAMQFNKNSFGLAPTAVQLASPFILPGMSGEATVPITITPNQLNPTGPPSNIIQMAIKAGFQGQDKVMYFQMVIPLHVLFIENGRLDRDEYLATWKGIQEEHFRDINIGLGVTPETIKRKFEANRLFFIAPRAAPPQEFLYFSARLVTNQVLLLELSLGPAGCKACAKTRNVELVTLFLQSVQQLLG